MFPGRFQTGGTIDLCLGMPGKLGFWSNSRLALVVDFEDFTAAIIYLTLALLLLGYLPADNRTLG
jgi:hypothetical protein